MIFMCFSNSRYGFDSLNHIFCRNSAIDQTHLCSSKVLIKQTRSPFSLNWYFCAITQTAQYANAIKYCSDAYRFNFNTTTEARTYRRCSSQFMQIHHQANISSYSSYNTTAFFFVLFSPSSNLYALGHEAIRFNFHIHLFPLNVRAYHNLRNSIY